MKLKKKNRKRLEDWYIMTNAENILDYEMWDLEDMCYYGFKGVIQLTDAELLEEYKKYAIDWDLRSML